jgi:hypothetical protein
VLELAYLPAQFLFCTWFPLRKPRPLISAESLVPATFLTKNQNSSN